MLEPAPLPIVVDEDTARLYARPNVLDLGPCTEGSSSALHLFRGPAAARHFEADRAGNGTHDLSLLRLSHGALRSSTF